LRRKAEALRNSGDENKAQMYEDQAEMITILPPQIARGSTSAPLIAVMGADKYKSYIEAQGIEATQPYKLQQEATKAQYGEEEAILNLTAKGEEINKSRLEQKLKVIDSQLAVAKSDADIAKIQADREKVMADIEKIGADRGKEQNAKALEQQSVLDNAALGLDTVARLLSKENRDKLEAGTGIGSDFAAWFNGSDASDFRSQIATLESQQFLQNIKGLTGMGALSNAEGEKLQSKIASLRTSQSDKQMIQSLEDIKRDLEKAQQRALAMGAPAEGGAFVAKHPKFGTIREGDINRVMAANPGATRERVIQYLKSKGAQ
jgi:hypothetical protein